MKSSVQSHPATKQDIGVLKKDIADLEQRLKGDIMNKLDQIISELETPLTTLVDLPAGRQAVVGKRIYLLHSLLFSRINCSQK